MNSNSIVQGRHFLFELIDLNDDVLRILTFSQKDFAFKDEQLRAMEAVLSALRQYIWNWSNRDMLRVQMSSPEEQHNQELNSSIVKMEGIVELTLTGPGHSFKKRLPEDQSLNVDLARGGSISTKFQLKLLLKGAYQLRNPFRVFNGKKEGVTVEFFLNDDGDNYQQHCSEVSLMAKLFSTRNVEKQKSILVEEIPPLDLLKYGSNMLSNIELFAPTDQQSLLQERPYCFPYWALDRIYELETTHPVMTAARERDLALNHCTLVEPAASNPSSPCKTLNCASCWAYFMFRKQGNCGQARDCLLCHEYWVWKNLEWWYNDVFMPSFDKDNQPLLTQITLPDGSTTQKPARLKSLVVRGPRGSGKTKFFQSICGFLRHRIIHVKNRFHKDALKHLRIAWLMLLEDFNYQENLDMQVLKALVAGETTVLEGKWLSLIYEGGVPCVILCNEEKLYWYLYTNSNFNTQCKFIDLGDHLFIGPPECQKQSANMMSTTTIPHANFPSIEDRIMNAKANKKATLTKKRPRPFTIDDDQEKKEEDDDENQQTLRKKIKTQEQEIQLLKQQLEEEKNKKKEEEEEENAFYNSNNSRTNSYYCSNNNNSIIPPYDSDDDNELKEMIFFKPSPDY